MELRKGIYKHFKGNMYLLENEATHSETGERYAVYRPLYGDNTFFVRPLNMFFENVEKGGETFKRFEFISDAPGLAPAALDYMIECFADKRFVAHSLKVFSYAFLIGSSLKLDEGEYEALLVAAALHDVGIPKALSLFGTAAGPYQEEQGSIIARELMERLNAPDVLTERICFLVGKHHTPGADDSLALQALIEADFLVNFEEGNIPPEKIGSTYAQHFKTETGCAVYQRLFS